LNLAARSWIHGSDPEHCYCESQRGREQIAQNAHATRAHLDPIEAIWKRHGVALFNLSDLAASPVWLLTVPLPIVVLALLYQEFDRVRRYLLCHSGPPASDAALASAFDRWAAQARVFPQQRVAGSFGSGRTT
jgi:hypothetical protein